MTDPIIISLTVPFLSFIFEIYPRLLNRKFGVDIWTHLLYLKEYHKQGGIPKKIESGFLVSGEYDYPPMFIFLLSKFPFKLVEKYEFLFSAFFDSLHIILIFFISFAFTENLAIALVTQILYALTPIIVLENSSATPRSLGYSLFTMLFISLFLFIQMSQPILLLIAIISGGLIFLSHRFTTQGFLFFSVFFTILEKNPVYIAAFILSFLLAVILSKGFYFKVLKGHLGNLKFWLDNINYRFSHQVKGTYKEHKTKDFIFRLYNQFLKFPPFVLAITNPWILPVWFIFFFMMPADFIYQQMVWWVIFSYGLAIATISIPFLRFLGEGQRYLELSAFPAAFLSAKLLADSGNLLITSGYLVVGICCLITILVIQRKAIIKDRLRTVTLELSQIFNYLKSLKVKPRLLCIPHQITTSTIYHTGCPVFVNANYATISKISDVYPYLRKPISEIMEKHDLDMILLNEDYASAEDLKLGKYKIVKKFANFLLLEQL
jgi:hypothetical protein